MQYSLLFFHEKSSIFVYEMILILVAFPGPDLKMWRPWGNEEVETPHHF